MPPSRPAQPPGNTSLLLRRRFHEIKSLKKYYRYDVVSYLNEQSNTRQLSKLVIFKHGYPGSLPITTFKTEMGLSRAFTDHRVRAIKCYSYVEINYWYADRVLSSTTKTSLKGFRTSLVIRQNVLMVHKQPSEAFDELLNRLSSLSPRPVVIFLVTVRLFRWSKRHF